MKQKVFTAGQKPVWSDLIQKEILTLQSEGCLH